MAKKQMNIFNKVLKGGEMAITNPLKGLKDNKAKLGLCNCKKNKK